MLNSILGIKGDAEQTFDAGIRIPVTHVDTSSCYLVDTKTEDEHGYWAVVLGCGFIKNIKKPVLGKLKKAGIKAPLRFLKEIRYDSLDIIKEKGKKGIKLGEKQFFVGDRLKAEDLFTKGQKVQVTGTSKGKGFQGVMRRHGFKGGPRTHGQSDRERAPGSIGASTTPGRVFKGKKMAGRMGGDTVTIKNLKVVDASDTEVVLKGLVPGAKKGLLAIKALDYGKNETEQKLEQHEQKTEKKKD